MSLSLHVEGIVPPDETWQKHKAVWDACMAACVIIPEATKKFFNHETPDEDGVIIDLIKNAEADEREYYKGYIIDISALPKNIKSIRFSISH